MSPRWKLRQIVIAVLMLLVVRRPTAGGPSSAEKRDSLYKAVAAGNYKDAYQGLRPLALDPKADPLKVGKDLSQAIFALEKLGRVDEIDAFREAVVVVHKGNWRLLATAAHSCTGGDGLGYVVAGEFRRGFARDQGRYVSARQRDRVRALQLLQQAMKLNGQEKDKQSLGAFYLQFADVLLRASDSADETWRLQYLTDLTQLPDYEDGYHGYRQATRGAPVDTQGNPILYHLPRSYEMAANDGQRWRWLLAKAAETDPGLRNEADMILADFVRSQIGVQTMADYGYGFGDHADGKSRSGTYALNTLSDEETIAHLAMGTRRLQVPDEFNWIKIYERIAGRGKTKLGAQARDSLAQEYEDRRQYVKAALAWKQAIQEYGTGKQAYRQRFLDQIAGNWGRFEPAPTQPAGKSATVDFRFRNGNKVAFEARAVHVGKLLEDVKAYLKSDPDKLDSSKTDIGDIGYRLVEQHERQYVGAKVASWELGLKPRPEHIDDRVTITTPLTKPGAYLVTAQMAGGNTSRIIVWVSDTAILKMPLGDRTYFFVADAVTGTPIAKANLEFFGWNEIQVKPNQHRVDEVHSFETTTDADGQAIVGDKQALADQHWLIVARKPGADGQDGRFAYLGYTAIWYGEPEAGRDRLRVFVITDRPVYRPGQTVQFKAWVRTARYDQANNSSFANQTFNVEILDAKGEQVLQKMIRADEFGGLRGELVLPAEATLGEYEVLVHTGDEPPWPGSGTFRVEEYKKPEYEVKVKAPMEPVRLGDPITANIQAKYYFGAPVTSGQVKYKVMRRAHDACWYPAGAWDWLYGRGYGRFAADSAWYPGWNEWTMRRPTSWWWGTYAPPEVVMENEVEIGADGSVPVVIDTKPARELHGDRDHEYTITAEVTDPSRRTIVGTNSVLVSRTPFQVYVWVDRGFYRVGDTVKAALSAQTIDRKPVHGKGVLTLYRISYDDKNEPVEKAVQTRKVDTTAERRADQQIEASQAGQYRLSYKLTDAQKNTIEGGHLFLVRGEGFTGSKYRFNDIELTSDRREYKPGDKAKLLINNNRENGTVLLFTRPADGVYAPPKIIRLKGKSTQEEIDIAVRDMPNCFVEAVTIHGGKVHSEVRELIVPPEKRILNVEVMPSQTEYKPGQKAAVKIKLTDHQGKPFAGSTVVTIYDKSVEYISDGSNVPEIKEFFWSWRRQHYSHVASNLDDAFGNLLRRGETSMSDLGVFGDLVVEETKVGRDARGRFGGRLLRTLPPPPVSEGGPADLRPARKAADRGMAPTVRKNFADTALWEPLVSTNAKGDAEVKFTLPEQMTGWKVRVWGMGHGTEVGEGTADIVTKRDLIVRLQAPRFFVEKDEAVLSANVHNFLKKDKPVTVTLELDGGTLTAATNLVQQATIAAGGEKRFDWRVKVHAEGSAVVRMKAVCDVEADAMEMRFPCYVHGMLKMESFTGVIRPKNDLGEIIFNVPAERRINETRLEVRYSPSLASAMVDALPYLVDYPHGCTEQTLNRFLPTVVTQNVLLKMKLDLKEIEKTRTNLNSQEIGDAKARIKGWKRFDRNPVFDDQEVARMVRAGVARLAAMQQHDGGWGWFSGWGEYSSPHTTAVVVHGLQVAKAAKVELPQNMLEHGIDWLQNYQADALLQLKNAATKTLPYKHHADDLDAFVHMVLVDQSTSNDAMRDFLYRDRTRLSVCAKAMFGLTLEKQHQADKLAMILQNIEQYLVQDDDNQTAYLRLPVGTPWYYWYGDETEANAYYLKLLARTAPKGDKASRLVKYLLNNRKHSTYWNSTRDTAICIEALAEYIQASGEDRPDMTVEVWLDGKKHKEVKIDTANLFTFDNKLVLVGDAIATGNHTLEIKRKGAGPVYYNAYLTNFTLEDFIAKTGLEVKVDRKYYKLVRDDQEIKAPGSIGQPLGQKIERYKRIALKNLDGLKSGDLVEVELEIDSKNDYEYLLFEDMKPSGFEPVQLRSGYTNTGLHAYTEFRDEKVCFFARTLARGKHSVSYRLRAETPGQFSALPARAAAMYAPELRANSDEIKLRVSD